MPKMRILILFSTLLSFNFFYKYIIVSNKRDKPLLSWIIQYYKGSQFHPLTLILNVKAQA